MDVHATGAVQVIQVENGTHAITVTNDTVQHLELVVTNDIDLDASRFGNLWITADTQSVDLTISAIQLQDYNKNLTLNGNFNAVKIACRHSMNITVNGTIAFMHLFGPGQYAVAAPTVVKDKPVIGEIIGETVNNVIESGILTVNKK